MGVIKNALSISHDWIQKVVKEGNLVIDATMGNGYDTLFLAALVGPTGMVYSFDIQDLALSNTQKRLNDNGMQQQVQLICDGHQNMKEYVKQEVAAVMFNLGYLPGGDHDIATCFEVTKAALEAALTILKRNGIITIVVYSGGDSGFMEKDQILQFVKTLNRKQVTVMQTEFVNQGNDPPILICIEKIGCG